MSDTLNPRARAFLRSVQDADDPTRDDYERVRAGVKARLAASVAAGVATLLSTRTVAASKAAAAASVSVGTATGAVGTAAAIGAGAGAGAGGAAATGLGAALVTKVAVAVVAVGLVAGGTTVAVRQSSPRAPVTVVASGPGQPGAPGGAAFTAGPRAARAVEPGAAQPGLPAINPQPLPPGSVEVAEMTPVVEPAPAAVPVPGGPVAAGAGPLPGVRPAPGAARPASPVQAAATPAADGPSALDAEIALVRDARAALRAGDPSRALSLLDDHDWRFPGGALSEDCAAERIYVLCALGRTDEARARAARFIASHSASPHASAVRASCGMAGEKK